MNTSKTVLPFKMDRKEQIKDLRKSIPMFDRVSIILGSAFLIYTIFRWIQYSRFDYLTGFVVIFGYLIIRSMMLLKLNQFEAEEERDGGANEGKRGRSNDS